MNYFPFHLGDYAAHTAHLEPMEDLAYRRLLDQYYLREGALPADIQTTAKLIRMRSMIADVEAVLKEFFILTEEGWKHARCDEEIERMQDKQAKARASAQASVNARKAKALNERSTDVVEIVSERLTDVQEKQADVELPTPTPTPTPNTSVAKATGGKPPMSPDEIIFGYGIPLLTNAGTPDKQARSFLGGLRKQHGDEIVINTLRDCLKAKPLQPLEWLASVLPPKGTLKRNKQEQVEDENRAIVRRLLEKEAQNASL